MRIEQLEYIAAVTRLGSLRRAAEELHISQPALSATVRNLERELGVDLLDRKRSGATISDEGRELLPHIVTVIEAVDRLRGAADDQHHISRMVRVGTVNAGTVPLLIPAIRDFHASYPTTQVEVVGAQEADIHQAMFEGRLDLGLVTGLEGDDQPPELETTVLLRGRAVVCMRADSHLVSRDSVGVADLLAEPLIVMRTGYLMHRLLHRLIGPRAPSFSYSTDGGEMGKLMVAEGLGVTLLPDFSVAGDPLERSGLITYRPLRDDDTTVTLLIQRRRSGAVARAVRDLQEIVVDRAGTIRPPAVRSSGPGSSPPRSAAKPSHGRGS